jgi:hypothetical protein
MYGNVRDIAPLLADSLFPVPKRRADVDLGGDAQARMPAVINMPDRAKFEAAVVQWHADISFDSFPADMKEHESFADIVAQGYGVVPLIAAHLRRRPSFLFLALEEIFGEDPVPEEAYGNVRSVSAAWLEWLQR